MLALGFKQCKSNAGVYYFIDKETKKLIITIIYINNICFIGLKDFLFLLELKWKFIIKWECLLELKIISLFYFYFFLIFFSIFFFIYFTFWT